MSIETQLKRECEDLAARYWVLAASDRGLGYQRWLFACQKYANYLADCKSSKQKAEKYRRK